MSEAKGGGDTATAAEAGAASGQAAGEGAGARLLVAAANPWALAAYALVLAQFLVRLVFVPQSFWWQDDFLHLDLARRTGGTWDFLVRDYNDHLEIVPNLVYWGLSHVTGASWSAAATVILSLQLIASLLMVTLLREVLGDRPALLVPAALYLFTPLLLVPTMWLAAGLEAWPLQISLIGTLLGLTRLVRTGRRRWAVLALLALVVGLLSWEKALLVGPAALGWQVLVLGGGTTWAERAREVLRRWWLWAAMALLSAAYLALYLVVTDGSERVAADNPDYLRAVGGVVFRTFIPGLFGGPWTSSGALNTIYGDPGVVGAILFAVAAAVVVAATFWRSGARALGPWSWLAAYLVVDVALMILGRTTFLVLIARDPRYIADAVAIAAIALAALMALPARGTAARAEPGDEARGSASALLGTRIAVGGAALLVVSGLLTTLQLIGTLKHQEVRDFVTTALAQLGTARSGVLNDEAPNAVVAEGDMRLVVNAMGASAPWDQPGTDLGIFDERGRIVDVTIADPVVEEEGPGKDCGWVVRRRTITLAEIPADSSANVLKVAVLGGDPGVLTFGLGDEPQSVDIAPGLGNVYVPTHGRTGEISVVFEPERRGAVCLSDLEVGRARPGD